MSARVSLSALSDAGIHLTPADAAAIVSDICRQITAGELRGVPSPHVIRFSDDGQLSAEGPVGADRATVARAAKLLDSMLDISGEASTPEHRIPGALKIVIARAQGTLDLPPYAGLDEFAAAIRRFAAGDLQKVVSGLYAAWAAGEAGAEEEPVVAEALVPAPAAPVAGLSISDVRRARRATGLTLSDVAERSRVPESLLLELEWGYLRNWPAGLYGRAQLLRYARAAGLDERVVLDAAWPLLEDAIAARGGDAVAAQPATRPVAELLRADSPVIEVEAIDEDDVAGSAALRPVPFPAQPAPARKRRWLAALAIPAAIAVAFVPTVLHREHAGALLPAISATRDQHLPSDTAPVPPARGVVPARRGAVKRDQPAPPTEPTRAIRENAAYSPSFSNEGTAMFFHEEGNGRSALVRADTDPRGTVLKITRIVDDNAQNFNARPSPDGRAIAFDSDREGVRGVYVATAEGTNVRRVSGDGFAAVPSWSPDGRRLAFVKAEAADPGVWNLWLTDLQTGDQRRVTSYTDGQPWGCSWFPDNRRIAYSHGTEVVVTDLATERSRTFETPLAGHAVRTPSVSPDGSRIIFQVARDGAWLLDVNRGTMRRVLDDPTAEEFTWSPDGRRVAFHSHRSGGWGVWVLGQ